MKIEQDVVDTGQKIPKVVDVDYLGGHTIFLRFQDGKEGKVDLSALVKEGVFRALENASNFSRFGLERGTLVWRGGLDISPEYLYHTLH